MNWPNLITIGRLLLTLGIFVLLAPAQMREQWRFVAALVLFGLAALSDMVDGWIARRQGLETSFGRFADPFVDKVLVCGTYVFLAALDAAPVALWMAVAIISREFMVTCVRSYLELRGVPFAAHRAGKLKMLLQCLNLAFLLAFLAFCRKNWLAEIVADIFTSLVVAYTVSTGLVYAWYARRAWSEHAARAG